MHDHFGHENFPELLALKAGLPSETARIERLADQIGEAVGREFA